MLGYGEISAALVLHSIPGSVCKRMAGFADEHEGMRYAEAVKDYLEELAAARIRVADTRLALVSGHAGRPIAYLVQPLLSVDGLASHLLRTDQGTCWLDAIRAVLSAVESLFNANALRKDRRSVAVDAQLSNWWFAPEDIETPTLIDVGTPFLRTDGVDECGTGFFLAPVPGALRWYYRRQRAVERYIDDYFQPHSLLLDLLGNFHKEGAAERIPQALPLVNAWLEHMGAPRITEADVAQYYQRDAADLELYLRVRRMDRWVKNILFRQQYPFILPGPIKR